jgi:chromosome segregation ATPase
LKEGIFMRKILIVTIVAALLLSLAAPIAFADPDNDKANSKSQEKQEQKEEAKADREEAKTEREQLKDQKTLEREEKLQERKEERETLKEDFRERMMERAELRTAAKEELRAQRQVVQEYKLQLQTLLEELGLTEEEIEAMSPEELAAYSGEIESLMEQIRLAQKQQLEIVRAYKDDIKEIYPGVRTGQAPSQEEVEEAVEVLDDL